MIEYQSATERATWEIYRACEQSLTGVSAFANDGTTNSLRDACRELGAVKTHLEEAERYFPWGRRGDLRRKM